MSSGVERGETGAGGVGPVEGGFGGVAAGGEDGC